MDTPKCKRKTLLLTKKIISVLPKNEAKLIENSDNDVDYEFDECGIKIEAPDSFYLVQGKNRKMDFQSV